MLGGWRKTNGLVLKKIPVEANIPKHLVNIRLQPVALLQEKTGGGLALIAFYYLLQIGEYIIKGSCNESKQIQQFKVADITFFKRDNYGNLRQLPRQVQKALILTTDSATLTLDNQKNGWHGICMHHESKRDSVSDPVHALGHRMLHIRENTPGDDSIFLSAVYDNEV